MAAKGIGDPCPCNNIVIMQLFHELKQKYPAVPDSAVSECIRQKCHDKEACERLLARQNHGYLMHSYPMALKLSVAAEEPATAGAQPNCCSSASPSCCSPSSSLCRARPEEEEEEEGGVVCPPLSAGRGGAGCPRGRPAARSRASLTMEPAPHYAATGSGAVPPQQPRSYTSVNLTLRPPSLDPLPPIDIHSAGTSLTYSTSSYDPRQGYQSQLQIRIGPGGVGSASAQRTRAPRPRSCFAAPAPELAAREEMPPPPPAPAPAPAPAVARADSLPDVASMALQPPPPHVVSELLAMQLARKEVLEGELRRERHKLREMQREVRLMETDLSQRRRRQREASLGLPLVTSVLQKMQCLRQEIQILQQECDKMDTEVQLTAADPQADEAFYKNIYTGQRGCVLNRHHTANTHRRETRGPNPPPDVGLDLDGPNWTCTECTFRNHPLLDKCEQCEMPRIILGTDSKAPLSDRCYCHPSVVCDKICLPNPLTPLPTMIMNKDTLQQIQN